MNFKLYKNSFLCSSEDYLNSKVVLAGIPLDFTVSFKPGSRFGPSKIREVSSGLEEYSVYQNKNLFNKVFCDMGDLELPFGNVDKCIDIIFEFGKKVFQDDKIPIFLGGEHLISFPLIKAAKEMYDELVVLHFDAHADMRDDYMGEKLSHATVMRRAGEVIEFKNLYQFGIRSGSEDEILFAKENSNIFFIYEMEKLFEVLPKLQNKKIYLSIDIDVVDPAFAPGTGTPEPGGLTSSQFLEIILKMKDLDIIGADIVEVSPYYDISDRTSLLAAKIVRELILLLG
ncbi:agmatinase [Caldicellulosiruptor naganoensis]|uniref:Agmatinase n=1 Tax=Caldicellulosiruptor naganoensis TaxID=29324 RepID=A0ABY7BDY4_9FIRM|nr:agmatinase [Caldicellulosiruptor naganoensis]WAM30650.1 agmatinase [Caldicellulosiruptor naganoensis]